MTDPAESLSFHHLVLVTGPSGAGRSTVFHALEDLGYEVIDNLPLSLIPRLLDGPPLDRPIALGLDVRNRDFSTAAAIELIDRLTRDPRVTLEVLYLDCAAGILQTRYNQTRRHHPLAETLSPSEGIDREIDHAKNGRPAGIQFKLNSILDEYFVAKLYEASQAGVEIELLIPNKQFYLFHNVECRSTK